MYMTKGIKWDMMRKVILPIKQVNQTPVQMNLTTRNLRPGREAVPQTGKCQRSRRNLKCTKSKELSRERKATCQRSQETKWRS